MSGKSEATEAGQPAPAAESGKTAPEPASQPEKVPEVGGRGGLDPTRYGDWEKNGRCIDF